jgi:hypothetical protein
VLLVAACRSLAIPARVVGIRSWKLPPDAPASARGFHQWIEIWDGGWRYLGAFDPGRVDVGWFADRAAATDPTVRRHRVHAAASVPTGLYFPLPWDAADRTVPALDVTPFYTRRRTVRVAVGAGQRFEIRHHGELVAAGRGPGAERPLAVGERYDWRLLDDDGEELERGSTTLAEGADELPLVASQSSRS